MVTLQRWSALMEEGQFKGGRMVVTVVASGRMVTLRPPP